MKFTIQADFNFEAETPDEALLKLGLYFIAQMDMRPIISISGDDLGEKIIRFDITSMLADTVDVIIEESIMGGCYVAAKDVMQGSETLQ